MISLRLLFFVLLINLLIDPGSMAATNAFSVVNNSISSYRFNGSAEDNPALTLVRSFTYTFNINASGHPFWIKIPPGGTGTGNAYNDGVTGNGTAVGTITFAVPANAPDSLQYNCQIHASMTGEFNIIDPPAIQITGLSVNTDALIQSTGTDALNLNILVSTDLSSNVWENATILQNTYSDGTNSTHVELPAANAAFFRVQQGFL